MDEKNVKVLASLLNTEDDKVKTAVESDGGLETLVKKFNEDNQTFNLKEFAKLKVNLRSETIESLTEDDIPKEFKNKAVGWKLEALEKEIKEDYSYEGDYENLKGLVSNIVEQAKDNKGDDTVLKDNKTLKEKIVAMEKDKLDAVKLAKENFDGQLINLDFDRALDNLGLNYEQGDALDAQKKLFTSAFKAEIPLRRKDGATVMIGEDKKDIVDNILNPVPLEDGFSAFAKKYGFQLKELDTAGQGGSSSKQKNTVTAGTTFEEYRIAKGVRANTGESDTLFKEWKEAQPAT